MLEHDHVKDAGLVAGAFALAGTLVTALLAPLAPKLLESRERYVARREARTAEAVASRRKMEEEMLACREDRARLHERCDGLERANTALQEGNDRLEKMVRALCERLGLVALTEGVVLVGTTPAPSAG